jgi:carbamoyl-phosphate synthase small subunit
MTGYQEILLILLIMVKLWWLCHIGNYGVNENEVESDGIKISGLVCKNFSFNHSRADSSESLEDYFIKQNLICISDVDTRALVSYIRDNGAMNAVICTDGTSIDLLKLPWQTFLI